MSYELLYTSAARGLKPGSQGFCVVVSTQGLATNLSDRLESLSGYRHVFPAQDAQAALNPIVWSHLRLSVAGRSYHVLSRIAASGLDYTQRSNKIAHHVALEPAELSAAGPAALLLARGFMATDWDGEPKLLPHGRTAPAVTATPAICRAWQSATGDAGWGGVLAESAAGSTSRPVLLIYNPGTDVLGMMAESLALLPPERRWQVTFSSYYTRLPAGVDCQWRGLVADSPEALAARQVPGALVIDLTRTLGTAQGGALVTLARTGRAVAEVKHAPAAAAHALPVGERVTPAGAGGATLPLATERRTTYPPLADSGIELMPPLANEPLWIPPVTRKPTPKPQPRWPLWLASAVAVLVCVSLALGAWMRFSEQPTVAQQDRHPTPPKQVDPRPDHNGSQSHTQVDDRSQIRPRSKPPSVPVEPDPEESRPDLPEPQAPDELTPSETVDRPLFGPDPLEIQEPPVQPVQQPPHVSFDSLPAFVELPQIVSQPELQPLFTLPAAAVDYSLKLRGARMADGAQLVLKRDGEYSFSILVEFNSAVGGSERIARLELHDGKLAFRWEQLKNAEQRLRWRELKNQVLLVSAEGVGKRAVALRKPEPAVPLRLAFSGKPAESAWELETPPPGDYSPQVWVGETLSLASRGQNLSVNLRSAPISTPVKMTVDVIPPKVFGKHMLQTRLNGSIRLTYRGVHISREHLKADDPHALESTADPELITPDALGSYMGALGQRIKSDEDKLKSLGPPPGSGPPPGAPPPSDEVAKQRQQLTQNIHRDREHMRQAAGLGRLFAALQSTNFDFRICCDIDGNAVCVVSTNAPAAPLVKSASGP